MGWLSLYEWIDTVLDAYDMPTRAILDMVRKLAGQMQLWLLATERKKWASARRHAASAVSIMHSLSVLAEEQIKEMDSKRNDK